MITITHTPAEGTLLQGTAKGDGTNLVLKTDGRCWRWSTHLGAWYVPRSRDTAPRTALIADTAQKLRAAGHTVTVTIDAGRRGTTDIEADKADRQQDRADALADKAARRAAARMPRSSGPATSPAGSRSGNPSCSDTTASRRCADTPSASMPRWTPASTPPPTPPKPSGKPRWPRSAAPPATTRSPSPTATPIAGLHAVLQIAFGWNGDHLHRFVVHGREYGIASAGRHRADEPSPGRLGPPSLRDDRRHRADQTRKTDQHSR